MPAKSSGRPEICRIVNAAGSDWFPPRIHPEMDGRLSYADLPYRNLDNQSLPVPPNTPWVTCFMLCLMVLA